MQWATIWTKQVWLGLLQERKINHCACCPPPVIAQRLPSAYDSSPPLMITPLHLRLHPSTTYLHIQYLPSTSDHSSPPVIAPLHWQALPCTYDRSPPPIPPSVSFCDRSRPPVIALLHWRSHLSNSSRFSSLEIAPFHLWSLPSTSDRSPPPAIPPLKLWLNLWSLLFTGNSYPPSWPEIAPLHIRSFFSTSDRSRPPAIAPLHLAPATTPLNLRSLLCTSDPPAIWDHSPPRAGQPAIAPVSCRRAGPRIMANSKTFFNFKKSKYK